MQTFLPLESFRLSAMVLDYRRLGKQRVECKQIMNAIHNGGGWRNHPAVKMWVGYEDALYTYYNHILQEWESRGYVNNMFFINHYPDHRRPPWLGDPAFHASHRSNLLRKDPEHYGRFGWTEPTTLEYVWPV